MWLRNLRNLRRKERVFNSVCRSLSTIKLSFKSKLRNPLRRKKRAVLNSISSLLIRNQKNYKLYTKSRN